MTSSNRMSIFAALVLFMAMAATAAVAQETSLSGTLLKTYAKANSTVLFMNSTPAAATSAFQVACPLTAKQCFLKITLSAQFNGLTPGDPNDIVGIVNVTGTGVQVFPYNVLGLDSTSTGGGSNARTTTWVTGKLLPGKYPVAVFLYTSGGYAGSFCRTVTVDVYRAD